MDHRPKSLTIISPRTYQMMADNLLRQLEGEPRPKQIECARVMVREIVVVVPIW